MALTLDDLTVSIGHLDRGILLREWHWLIGPNKVPALITALGNAFVVDTTDGSVHVIDSGPGTLQQVAASRDELRQRLRDKDFVVEHFVPVIVMRMRERGVKLAPGQLYGFITPPPLGGEYSPDNLEPTDIRLHFALLGQIHQRARGPSEEIHLEQVEIIQ